jgi:hypothetical protein
MKGNSLRSDSSQAPARTVALLQKLFILALVLTSTQNCTQNAQYRPAAGWVETILSKGASASFGVIEFDDHGFFWDRKQLEQVVETIGSASARAESSRHEVLVFVFVHGWNHNAESSDQNLVSARELVRALALAEMDPETGSGRPVVGVYLAWRGKRASSSVLQKLSYWNRNAGAVRVGSSLALGDSLREILDVTKSLDSGGNANSRVVVVGHSMGSLILQQSMAGLLPNATIGSNKVAGPGLSLSPRTSTMFPDLVVLLNSAASSLQALQIVEHLQDHNVQRWVQRPAGRYRAPLLISLTSETDRATSLAFKVGRSLDPYRGAFRRTRAEPFPHDQRSFYFTSDGHNRNLWSHEMGRVDEGVSVCPRGEPEKVDHLSTDLLRAPGYKSMEIIEGDLQGFEIDLSCRSKTDQFERYRFRRRKNSENRSAFWFAHLPKAIVDGHGDIFGNPALLQLVIGLADLSSVLEPARVDARAEEPGS